MTTKAKRILCLLLSMVMLLSLLPMAALADGGGTTFGEGWTDLNSCIAKYITNDTEIKLPAGKYYLEDSDLNIEEHFLQVEGDADVTIDLNGHVLSTSGFRQGSNLAIKVTGTSSLTVQDSSPTKTGNKINYLVNNFYHDKTFTGGVIFSQDRCISADGHATITLEGGTIFNAMNCVSLSGFAVLYADGGVIDGNVTAISATITRHDGEDYTTFKGNVVNDGGNSTIDDAAMIPVKFVDSGTTFDTKYVFKGQKLTKPDTDPTKTSLDLTFDGWTTADGTTWDFDTPVTAPMTLYAKWQHGDSWTALSDVTKGQGDVINLATNGKYYLDADLSGFNWISISADVTIDLNGHTLTSKTECAIKIFGPGQLTLLDSGTGGEVKGSSSNSNLNAPVIKLLGSENGNDQRIAYLTLKGGTIYGSVEMDCNDAPCTLYAEGGTVKGDVQTRREAKITRNDGADYTTFEGSVSGTIEDAAKLTGTSAMASRSTSSKAKSLASRRHRESCSLAAQRQATQRSGILTTPFWSTKTAWLRSPPSGSA